MKTIITKFLFFLTKRILKKYNPDRIGIVGASGKSATKDVLAKILAKKFRIRKSVEGLGNKLNIFLTIIGLESFDKTFLGRCKILLKSLKLLLVMDKNYPEVLLLEIGTDKIGDLYYATEFINCQIGVVTGLKGADLRLFKTQKKLVQEMRILVSHLNRDGYAVLNYDDEEVRAMAKKTDADVLTYGFAEGSDICGSDVMVKTMEKDGQLGIYFKVTYAGSVVPMYLVKAKDKQDIYEVLPAIAVALAMGFNLVEISGVLKEF